MKKLLWLTPLALAYFVLNTLYVAGVFKSINSHAEGEISRIYTNVPGTEDLAIDRHSGKMFISSTDRWKLQEGEISFTDGIYLLQLDSRNDKPPELLFTALRDFHPHGISLLRDNGDLFLFVVNHNGAGDFVEKFRFAKDTLFHINRFHSDLMCCPNDVVAVDINRFYVTNDHGNKKGFSRTLEDYLRIPKSSVFYFDGNSFQKAVSGLNYANGINISNDGNKLFVTETTAGLLNSYEINKNTGALTKIDELNLHTGVDNISIGPDGSLLIGAHPKLFAFVGHATDKSKMSPSQVILLKPNGPNDFSVSEIYLDLGDQLSGSSVAVQFENDVFVGVVFESKLLRMRLPR